MRLLLIFLFAGLLLVLAVAIGTEVAALRHSSQPVPAAVRVVVRKARAVPSPRRSVQALGHRAGRRWRQVRGLPLPRADVHPPTPGMH